MDYFKTISRPEQAEYKDRGSKFIAYAFPMQNIDAFKQQLAIIKKEHAKAVHHCFAYRLGLDGNQFRVSDDGEPSGTAGKPILGQIDSRGLTNTGIVVVRYFGGTLLGVPGLINAYKTVAALVLQIAPIEEKAVEETIQISCTYHDINEVIRIIKSNNGNLLTNDQALFCNLTASLPKNRTAQAMQQLGNLYQIEVVKK